MRCLVPILAGLLAGCSSPCGDFPVVTRRSPDGSFDAVVFYRDCGAVTRFTTEISIVRSRVDALSGGHAGKVFKMIDPDDSKESLERNGAIEARLAWKSPRILSRSTPRKARVLERRNRMNGIKIEYRNFA